MAQSLLVPAADIAEPARASHLARWRRHIASEALVRARSNAASAGRDSSTAPSSRATGPSRINAASLPEKRIRFRPSLSAAECEAWLDCGDEAGTVLAALRLGLKRIRFSGSDAALIRLGPVARELGAVLESRPAEAAFDLARTKASEAMCRRHLAK